MKNSRPTYESYNGKTAILVCFRTRTKPPKIAPGGAAPQAVQFLLYLTSIYSNSTLVLITLTVRK